MIKAGVVGVGVMGRNHARVYRELDNVILYGVYDIDRERSEYVAELYDCKNCSTLESLIENVDLVSIVVPTVYHLKTIENCLQIKDVGILVEKPVADSLENGRKLLDLSRKHFISVGHIERFNPAVQKAKELIESGELGKILTITAKRVGPFVDRILDVGVMVDLAIHDVDVMQFLLGLRPKKSYLGLQCLKNNKGDSGVLVVEFNDIIGVIITNWYTPTQIRELIITGTSGVMYVNYINQTVIIDKSNFEVTPKFVREEPLKLELEDFVYKYSNKLTPSVPVTEALMALEIVV